MRLDRRDELVGPIPEPIADRGIGLGRSDQLDKGGIDRRRDVQVVTRRRHGSVELTDLGWCAGMGHAEAEGRILPAPGAADDPRQDRPAQRGG